MWIIVNFIEDDTVAIVPKAWLQDGMCPWETGKTCQKLIKNLCPPSNHFEKLQATQISTFQSDNYQVALRKLRLAEDTSSLSCDDDSSLLQPRKRNPNSSYVDFVSGESSRTIAEPPILDMQLANFLTEATNLLDLDNSVAVAHANNNFANNLAIELNNNIAKNALHENANDKTPAPTGECHTCKNLMTQFETLKVQIEVNQKWITRTVEDISKKIQDLVTMTSFHNAATEDIKWKFPIESLEDMDRFENDLKAPDFKLKMLQHLSRVGGSSAEDSTRRLWKYLLTVELQYKCNWTGLKNKRPLKDTLLNELIQHAVQQSFGTATLKTIQGTTKDYIQHASNRKKK